ncbi:hypothetical protein LJC58_05070 [Lachnospiraceae bacterium OttesenSCG-928-D06]|nr:hypothetical protein [Lachnospiraceae bacterium OttesenSCG-928-D06]
MSAIWGIVHLNQNKISMDSFQKMKDSFAPYKIDSFADQHMENASMGCAHQYLTPESFQETLPILDIKRNCLFSADVVLDNRDELLLTLANATGKIISKDLPDGALLYKAYCLFGIHFTDYILGAFSIAIYERNENRFLLFADQVCNRSIYYHYSKGSLYFGTTLQSITAALNCPLCEKWSAGFFSSWSPTMMLFPNLTPYESVYQLNAGEYVEVSLSSLHIHHYKNPDYHQDKKHLTTENAQGILCDTLSLCVNSLLRSAKNHGCTLSSGLDSTSVAAFAARRLSKDLKTLYSYTAVPLRSYQSNKDSFYRTDESLGVLALYDAYPNISPSFLDYPKKNAFSELGRLNHLIGYPSKSLQNLAWLDDIYHTAHTHNCTIILKGQYGNATLSYGTIMTAIYQTLCALKPFASWKLLSDFCKKNHVSRKRASLHFLANIKERLLPKSLPLKHSILKKQHVKKYGLVRYYQKALRQSGGKEIDSKKERQNFLYYTPGLAQLGVFDTMFGLIHGLVIRDPLKDIRFITLCERLPIECSVAGSVERGMARTYMQGIVPHKILRDVNHRGLQSADSLYRMQLNWTFWKKEIKSKLSAPCLKQYLDENSLLALEKSLEESTSENLTEELLQKINILFSYVCFFETTQNSTETMKEST